MLQKLEGPVTSRIAEVLDEYRSEISSNRIQRLAEATKSIPFIFWVIIVTFVGAAAFMNGRNSLHRYGVHVMILHMAAIGMVVALILIVDNPFRGSTSVDPSIIGQALEGRST